MFAIRSDFDQGNIRHLDSGSSDCIRLQIESDTASSHSQWFFFRVDDPPDRLEMRIENAGECSYPDGWEDYRAVASYDLETWVRVDTQYKDGVLTIRHAPVKTSVFYAYFASCPMTRHARLVEATKKCHFVSHEIVGKSIDGRDVDYFHIGGSSTAKLNFWAIARQHPGETMGGWWMEGLLQRLTDENSESARALRDVASIHIVPCMNPDGVSRGHLRTNAVGVNQNRAWQSATAEDCPEVYSVRRKMHDTGVDFLLDVHGDETIPNNFVVGAEGIPSWSKQQLSLTGRYKGLLLEESQDFQTDMGYDEDLPGSADMRLACNFVAEHWNCLALTLEMPFKDVLVNPDRKFGWSPQRCKTFAGENLRAMARIAVELL